MDATERALRLMIKCGAPSVHGATAVALCCVMLCYVTLRHVTSRHSFHLGKPPLNCCSGWCLVILVRNGVVLKVSTFFLGLGGPPEGWEPVAQRADLIINW